MREVETRTVVRSIILTQFAPSFMFSGVAVALPAMGRELHAGATALGLVETLFLGSQLAFLLPVGRLADLSDKRSLYTFGLLGFGLTSLAISISSSIIMILVLRFLQGLASALFSVTGTALLAEIVPAPQRGRAFGSSIGAIYAGLTLGPVISGFLVDHAGWRAVFVFGGVVLVAAYVFTRLRLQARWLAPPPGGLHLPSVIVLVAAVLLLVGGSVVLPHSSAGLLLLAASSALVVLFLRLQSRIPQPLLDLSRLTANRVLRNALIVQLLLYFNAFSSTFMLSLFLQVSLSHSAQLSGQVLAAGTVLMAVVAPFAGRWSDHIGSKCIISGGIALILLAALSGTILSRQTSLGWIFMLVLLQGAGYGFFSSPNMKAIMNSVLLAESSVASALSATSRSLGIVGGTLLSTMLITVHAGSGLISEQPAALTVAVVQAYMLLSGITMVALLLHLGSTRE